MRVKAHPRLHAIVRFTTLTPVPEFLILRYLAYCLFCPTFVE